MRLSVTRLGRSIAGLAELDNIFRKVAYTAQCRGIRCSARVRRQNIPDGHEHPYEGHCLFLLVREEPAASADLEKGKTGGTIGLKTGA
jgi:hypothetical protein